MPRSGDATRARLLAATRDVVRRVGYPNATTRAIADAAGVAEGTIYRHFPDKVALFFAAAMSGNEPIVAELAALPERAGEATVADNLTRALVRLAELRRDLLPLELALLTDPEIARRRRSMDAPVSGSERHPPRAIASYLEREQRAGRVRADLDPTGTALVLLGALFGLSLAPLAPGDPGGDDGSDEDAIQASIAAFVDLVVHGLAV